MSYLEDLFNLEGKKCANDDHPAFTVWSYGPARYSGYRCVCCVRKSWETTLAELTDSLAGLPVECIPKEAQR